MNISIGKFSVGQTGLGRDRYNQKIVPGFIARIINVLQTYQNTFSDDINNVPVCTSNLPIDIDKRQRGFIQFLPVILFVVFASAIFLVVSQVQKQQEDIRSRASGPYPTVTNTIKPTPTSGSICNVALVKDYGCQVAGQCAGQRLQTWKAYNCDIVSRCIADATCKGSTVTPECSNNQTRCVDAKNEQQCYNGKWAIGIYCGAAGCSGTACVKSVTVNPTITPYCTTLMNNRGVCMCGCTKTLTGGTCTACTTSTPTVKIISASTACGQAGEVPVAGICCVGLSNIGGWCGIKAGKCPNGSLAPDGDFCSCKPLPVSCLGTTVPITTVVDTPAAGTTIKPTTTTTPVAYVPQGAICSGLLITGNTCNQCQYGTDAHWNGNKTCKAAPTATLTPTAKTTPTFTVTLTPKPDCNPGWFNSGWFFGNCSSVCMNGKYDSTGHCTDGVKPTPTPTKAPTVTLAPLPAGSSCANNFVATNSCSRCPGGSGTSDGKGGYTCGKVLPTTVIISPSSSPVCGNKFGCPNGWYCNGDTVPGTAGTSFAERYCTQKPSESPTVKPTLPPGVGMGADNGLNVGKYRYNSLTNKCEIVTVPTSESGLYDDSDSCAKAHKLSTSTTTPAPGYISPGGICGGVFVIGTDECRLCQYGTDSHWNGNKTCKAAPSITPTAGTTPVVTGYIPQGSLCGGKWVYGDICRQCQYGTDTHWNGNLTCKFEPTSTAAANNCLYDSTYTSEAKDCAGHMVCTTSGWVCTSSSSPGTVGTYCDSIKCPYGCLLLTTAGGTCNATPTTAPTSGAASTAPPVAGQVCLTSADCAKCPLGSTPLANGTSICKTADSTTGPTTTPPVLHTTPSYDGYLSACTQKNGDPGTCVKTGECHTSFDTRTCSNELGCCSGGKDDYKPQVGQKCVSSVNGKVGTCMSSSDIVGDPNYTTTDDQYTHDCQSGVCVYYKDQVLPGEGASCTLTAGWPGTCVAASSCDRVKANIAWQKNACSGSFGCCGTEPIGLPGVTPTGAPTVAPTATVLTPVVTVVPNGSVAAGGTCGSNIQCQSGDCEPHFVNGVLQNKQCASGTTIAPTPTAIVIPTISPTPTPLPASAGTCDGIHINGCSPGSANTFYRCVKADSRFPYPHMQRDDTCGILTLKVDGLDLNVQQEVSTAGDTQANYNYKACLNSALTGSSCGKLVAYGYCSSDSAAVCSCDPSGAYQYPTLKYVTTDHKASGICKGHTGGSSDTPLVSIPAVDKAVQQQNAYQSAVQASCAPGCVENQVIIASGACTSTKRACVCDATTNWQPTLQSTTACNAAVSIDDTANQLGTTYNISQGYFCGDDGNVYSNKNNPTLETFCRNTGQICSVRDATSIQCTGASSVDQLMQAGLGGLATQFTCLGKSSYQSTDFLKTTYSCPTGTVCQSANGIVQCAYDKTAYDAFINQYQTAAAQCSGGGSYGDTKSASGGDSEICDCQISNNSIVPNSCAWRAVKTNSCGTRSEGESWVDNGFCNTCYVQGNQAVVDQKPLITQTGASETTRQLADTGCAKYYTTSKDSYGDLVLTPAAAASVTVQTPTGQKTLSAGQAVCVTGTGNHLKCVAAVMSNGTTSAVDVQPAGASSSYAFACPSNCAVYGADSNSTGTQDAYDFTKIRYCSADGKGTEIKSTADAVKSSNYLACPSGVCSNGACVDGQVILDATSMKAGVCLRNTTCYAYDQTTGMNLTVQVTTDLEDNNIVYNQQLTDPTQAAVYHAAVNKVINTAVQNGDITDKQFLPEYQQYLKDHPSTTYDDYLAQRQRDAKKYVEANQQKWYDVFTGKTESEKVFTLMTQNNNSQWFVDGVVNGRINVDDFSVKLDDTTACTSEQIKTDSGKRACAIKRQTTIPDAALTLLVQTYNQSLPKDELQKNQQAISLHLENSGVFYPTEDDILAFQKKQLQDAAYVTQKWGNTYFTDAELADPVTRARIEKALPGFLSVNTTDPFTSALSGGTDYSAIRTIYADNSKLATAALYNKFLSGAYVKGAVTVEQGKEEWSSGNYGRAVYDQTRGVVMIAAKPVSYVVAAGIVVGNCVFDACIGNTAFLPVLGTALGAQGTINAMGESAQACDLTAGSGGACAKSLVNVGINAAFWQTGSIGLKNLRAVENGAELADAALQQGEKKADQQVNKTFIQKVGNALDNGAVATTRYVAPVYFGEQSVECFKQNGLNINCGLMAAQAVTSALMWSKDFEPAGQQTFKVITGAQAAVACASAADSGNWDSCAHSLSFFGMSAGAKTPGESEVAKTTGGTEENAPQSDWGKLQVERNNSLALYDESGKALPTSTSEQTSLADTNVREATFNFAQEQVLVNKGLEPIVEPVKGDPASMTKALTDQKSAQEAYNTAKTAYDDYAATHTLDEQLKSPEFAAYDTARKQLATAYTKAAPEVQALQPITVTAEPGNVEKEKVVADYEAKLKDFSDLAKTTTAEDPLYRQKYLDLTNARDEALSLHESSAQKAITTEIIDQRTALFTANEEFISLSEDAGALQSEANGKLLLDNATKQLDALIAQRKPGVVNDDLEAQIVAAQAKVDHFEELAQIRDDAANGNAKAKAKAQATIDKTISDYNEKYASIQDLNNQIAAYSQARTEAGTFLGKVRSFFGIEQPALVTYHNQVVQQQEAAIETAAKKAEAALNEEATKTTQVAKGKNGLQDLVDRIFKRGAYAPVPAGPYDQLAQVPRADLDLEDEVTQVNSDVQKTLNDKYGGDLAKMSADPDGKALLDKQQALKDQLTQARPFQADADAKTTVEESPKFKANQVKQISQLEDLLRNDKIDLDTYFERVDFIHNPKTPALRVEIPEGASAEMKAQIADFNKLLDDFEIAHGYHVNDQQLSTLLRSESILGLQAGGGKTTVIGPLLSAVDRMSVVALASSADAADYVNGVIKDMDFYESHGIKAYFFDSKQGFLEIDPSKPFDRTTAKAVDPTTVRDIVEKASQDPAKSGILVVTESSDNAWGVIQGRNGSDPSSVILNDLELGKYGKQSALLVDEVGKTANGQFSVSRGNPDKLSTITDPKNLNGMTDAQSLLDASGDVGMSTELSKFRNQVLSQLKNGQSAKSLFFSYTDPSGTYSVSKPYPADMSIVGKSYSELIDQTLANTNPSAEVKAQLESLRDALNADPAAEGPRQAYEALLKNVGFTGEDAQAINDLGYRTSDLQARWSILSKVPANDFGFEAVQGSPTDGEMVIRSSGGTTREVYSTVAQRIALQEEGLKMWDAIGRSTNGLNPVATADLTITADSDQITNAEIYKQKIAQGKFKGYDATPDTAATTLGTKSTARSERPPDPKYVTTATNQLDLIRQGAQDANWKAWTNGKTTAFVLNDSSGGVSFDQQTNTLLEENPDATVLIRTKYSTDINGNEGPTEYFIEDVTSDPKTGEITRKPRPLFTEEDVTDPTTGAVTKKMVPVVLDTQAKWSAEAQKILTANQPDPADPTKNPNKVMIVYEGRTRAVDFSVDEYSTNNQNIRWTTIGDDQNTMEDITQSWKRNRVPARANDLANAGWSSDAIKNASDYSLWVRTDDPTNSNLTDPSKIIDHYQEVLDNSLATARYENAIAGMSQSQSKALTTLRDTLIQNNPADETQIRSDFKGLLEQSDRAARAQFLEIQTNPLKSEDIPTEIWTRGKQSYDTETIQMEALKAKYNLTDAQFADIQKTLGLDTPYPTQDEFTKLYKEQALIVPSRSNPVGPSQIALSWAETNDETTLPVAVWQTKSDPNSDATREQASASVANLNNQASANTLDLNNHADRQKAITLANSDKTDFNLARGTEAARQEADDASKAYDAVFKAQHDIYAGIGNPAGVVIQRTAKTILKPNEDIAVVLNGFVDSLNLKQSYTLSYQTSDGKTQKVPVNTGVRIADLPKDTPITVTNSAGKEVGQITPEIVAALNANATATIDNAFSPKVTAAQKVQDSAKTTYAALQQDYNANLVSRVNTALNAAITGTGVSKANQNAKSDVVVTVGSYEAALVRNASQSEIDTAKAKAEQVITKYLTGKGLTSTKAAAQATTVLAAISSPIEEALVNSVTAGTVTPAVTLGAVEDVKTLIKLFAPTISDSDLATLATILTPVIESQPSLNLAWTIVSIQKTLVPSVQKIINQLSKNMPLYIRILPAVLPKIVAAAPIQTPSIIHDVQKVLSDIQSTDWGDTSGVTSTMTSVQLFAYDATYQTTLQDIINTLPNNNITNYAPKDFSAYLAYYLSTHPANSVKLTTPTGTTPIGGGTTTGGTTTMTAADARNLRNGAVGIALTTIADGSEDRSADVIIKDINDQLTGTSVTVTQQQRTDIEKAIAAAKVAKAAKKSAPAPVKSKTPVSVKKTALTKSTVVVISTPKAFGARVKTATSVVGSRVKTFFTVTVPHGFQAVKTYAASSNKLQNAGTAIKKVWKNTTMWVLKTWENVRTQTRTGPSRSATSSPKLTGFIANVKYWGERGLSWLAGSDFKPGLTPVEYGGKVAGIGVRAVLFFAKGFNIPSVVETAVHEIFHYLPASWRLTNSLLEADDFLFPTLGKPSIKIFNTNKGKIGYRAGQVAVFAVTRYFNPWLLFTDVARQLDFWINKSVTPGVKTPAKTPVKTKAATSTSQFMNTVKKVWSNVSAWATKTWKNIAKPSTKPITTKKSTASLPSMPNNARQLYTTFTQKQWLGSPFGNFVFAVARHIPGLQDPVSWDKLSKRQQGWWRTDGKSAGWINASPRYNAGRYIISRGTILLPLFPQLGFFGQSMLGLGGFFSGYDLIRTTFSPSGYRAFFSVDPLGQQAYLTAQSFATSPVYQVAKDVADGKLTKPADVLTVLNHYPAWEKLSAKEQAKWLQSVATIAKDIVTIRAIWDSNVDVIVSDAQIKSTVDVANVLSTLVTKAPKAQKPSNNPELLAVLADEYANEAVVAVTRWEGAFNKAQSSKSRLPQRSQAADISAKIALKNGENLTLYNAWVAAKVKELAKPNVKSQAWYDAVLTGMSSQDQAAIKQLRALFAAKGANQRWYYSGAGVDITPVFLAPTNTEQWFVDLSYDSSHYWYQQGMDRDFTVPFAKLGTSAVPQSNWATGWKNKRQTVTVGTGTKIQLIGGDSHDKTTTPDSIDVIYTNHFSKSPGPDAYIALKTGGYYVVDNSSGALENTVIQGLKIPVTNLGFELAQTTNVNKYVYPTIGSIGTNSGRDPAVFYIYKKTRQFTPEEEDLLQMSASVDEIGVQIGLYAKISQQLIDKYSSEDIRQTEETYSTVLRRYFDRLKNLQVKSPELINRVQTILDGYFEIDINSIASNQRKQYQKAIDIYHQIKQAAIGPAQSIIIDSKGKPITVGSSIAIIQNNGTIVSDRVSTIGTTPVRGDYFDVAQTDGKTIRLYISNIAESYVVGKNWTPAKAQAFKDYREQLTQARAENIPLTGELAVITPDGPENATQVKTATTRLQRAINFNDAVAALSTAVNNIRGTTTVIGLAKSTPDVVAKFFTAIDKAIQKAEPADLTTLQNALTRLETAATQATFAPLAVWQEGNQINDAILVVQDRMRAIEDAKKNTATPVKKASVVQPNPASVLTPQQQERAQLAQLVQEYNDIDARVNLLAGEESDALAVLTALQNQQQQMNQQSAGLAQINTQISDLQKQRTVLQNQRKKLQTNQQSLQTQIDVLDKQIEQANVPTLTSKQQAAAAQRVFTSLISELDKEIDQAVRAKASAINQTSGVSAADVRAQIVQTIRDTISGIQLRNWIHKQLAATPEFANDFDGSYAYADDMLAQATPEWFIRRHINTNRFTVSITHDPKTQVNSIAIGDVHGDWNALVSLLSGKVANEDGDRIARPLLDRNGHWIGGPNDQLILTGDLFDRAPEHVNSAQTAEKIMNLQKQAGLLPDGTPRVKVLIGNHDVNAVYAYWRMVENMQNRMSKKQAAEIGSITGMRPSISPEDLTYLYDHQNLVNWLTQLPAMMVQDDGTLYMHSDTLKYLDYGGTVDNVNTTIQSILTSGNLKKLDLLMTDLTNGRRELYGTNVDTMLKTYGAINIVHGHSQNEASSDPRVTNIDGGLSEHYAKGKTNRGRVATRDIQGKQIIDVAIQPGVPTAPIPNVSELPLSSMVIAQSAQQNTDSTDLIRQRTALNTLFNTNEQTLGQIDENLGQLDDQLQPLNDQQSALRKTINSSKNLGSDIAKAEKDHATIQRQLAKEQALLVKAKELIQAQKAIFSYLNSLRKQGISIGSFDVSRNVLSDFAVLSQKFAALVGEAINQMQFTDQAMIDRVKGAVIDAVPVGSFVQKVIEASNLARQIQTKLDQASKDIQEAEERVALIKQIQPRIDSGEIILSDFIDEMSLDDLRAITKTPSPVPVQNPPVKTPIVSALVAPIYRVTQSSHEQMINDLLALDPAGQYTYIQFRFGTKAADAYKNVDAKYTGDNRVIIGLRQAEQTRFGLYIGQSKAISIAGGVTKDANLYLVSDTRAMYLVPGESVARGDYADFPAGKLLNDGQRVALLSGLQKLYPGDTRPLNDLLDNTPTGTINAILTAAGLPTISIDPEIVQMQEVFDMKVAEQNEIKPPDYGQGYGMGCSDCNVVVRTVMHLLAKADSQVQIDVNGANVTVTEAKNYMDHYFQNTLVFDSLEADIEATEVRSRPTQVEQDDAVHAINRAIATAKSYAKKTASTNEKTVLTNYINQLNNLKNQLQTMQVAKSSVVDYAGVWLTNARYAVIRSANTVRNTVVEKFQTKPVSTNVSRTQQLQAAVLTDYTGVLEKVDFGSQDAPQAVQKIVVDEYTRLHPGLSPPADLISSVTSAIIAHPPSKTPTTQSQQPQVRKSEVGQLNIGLIVTGIRDIAKAGFDVLRNSLNRIFGPNKIVVRPQTNLTANTQQTSLLNQSAAVQQIVAQNTTSIYTVDALASQLAPYFASPLSKDPINPRTTINRIINGTAVLLPLGNEGIVLYSKVSGLVTLLSKRGQPVTVNLLDQAINALQRQGISSFSLTTRTENQLINTLGVSMAQGRAGLTRDAITGRLGHTSGTPINVNNNVTQGIQIILNRYKQDISDRLVSNFDNTFVEDATNMLDPRN